jgi:hypothetical protein
MKKKNLLLTIIGTLVIALTGFYSCSPTNRTNSFYQTISRSVLIYDSALYHEDVAKSGNIYIVRLVDISSDTTNFTYSITSLTNMEAINRLNPFYYYYLNGDIVILHQFGIAEATRPQWLFQNDTNKGNAVLDSNILVFNYSSSYSVVESPVIGIYNFTYKRRNKGILQYFFPYPYSTIPSKFRPIEDYHTDEYFIIDSVGVLDLPYAGNHFLKFQTLEDMYDNWENIKFTK